MNRNIQTRLSIMMFIQFFVWGAWYTTIAVYMTNHGMADLTHWPYTVNPIAAIIAPFFLGLVADRYFATEKVLGVLHILGGIFMFLAPAMVASPTLFILMVFLHNLCYMPTLGLSNTIAFHNVEDQEKQFPMIRVFGTIGWIIAGLFISFVLVSMVSDGLPEATALPLYTTAIGSILLGLYSFSLPHTPPPAKGQPVSIRSILGVDAFKQLGSRSFYIFIIASLLLCIPLAAYYNFTQIYLGDMGFTKIAGTQTLGQMSEIVFMLLIPFFFKRFGVKWMLAVGMGAWMLRYGLFAMGASDAVTWMILGGIALHGICYDFFFVTGQIYVDKKATPEIRGQAQGFIILVTYGIGMFFGARIAGAVFNSFLKDGTALSAAQWHDFWWIPAGFSLAVLLFFVLFFKDKVGSEE